MNFSVCKLLAGNYSEISSNVKLFNTNELTDYLWIKLPNRYSRPFNLIELDSIQPESCSVDITDDSVFKENIWVKIPKDKLNLSAGNHVYRIKLQSVYSEDTVVMLYFSYIIQDDNPDKPYIYMNRDSSTDVCKCEVTR